MFGIIVIGSQWGDEGKGKLVDIFSSKMDYVVRYQGGANAGHTLNIAGNKIILHLVPSGVLHSHTTCVIGAGVVLDIFGLVEEIQALKKLGYLKDHKQLMISESATVLMDYHKHLDHLREERAGKSKIGTTGRGIGPAYEDRITRKALRFGDIFLDNLKERITQSSKEKLFLMKEYYKYDGYSLDALIEKIITAREILKPYLCKDTSLLVHQAFQSNKKVLLEGAQGVLLDIFHGTYPYVTSSSTVSGSALTGLGMSWQNIYKVVGVAKAYATRVGQGPFPSECENHSLENTHLSDKGKERGSTTNRLRRCGWLDLVALKYALRLNGFTCLALMKLDVLSGLEKIKLCVGYELDGKVTDSYPVSENDLSKCKPVYKEFSGWNEDLSKMKSAEDLPKNARIYLDFIEEQLKIPIDMISVGPSRDEFIWVRPLF